METRTYALRVTVEHCNQSATVSNFYFRDDSENSNFMFYRIQVNDQIIEVDGKSLVGVTQAYAASVLRNTSGTIRYGYTHGFSL